MNYGPLEPRDGSSHQSLCRWSMGKSFQSTRDSYHDQLWWHMPSIEWWNYKLNDPMRPIWVQFKFGGGRAFRLKPTENWTCPNIYIVISDSKDTKYGRFDHLFKASANISYTSNVFWVFDDKLGCSCWHYSAQVFVFEYSMLRWRTSPGGLRWLSKQTKKCF